MATYQLRLMVVAAVLAAAIGVPGIRQTTATAQAPDRQSLLGAGSSNLVQDPQFESGTSGFFPQDPSSSVAQVSDRPLEGAHSLRVNIRDWGNNVWWSRNFAGRAANLSVATRLRVDTSSTSTLQYCAVAKYADGAGASACSPVAMTEGDKGVVRAQVSLDTGRRLSAVSMQLQQEGAMPITVTLDAAAAYLTILEAPSGDSPSDGGGSSGGGDPGGGSSSCSDPTTSPLYTPAAVRRPAARPFVSLERYTQVDRRSDAYARFKANVDAAIAGDTPYAYSARDSVIMYRITGSDAYIRDAIMRVETMVSAAEAAVGAGRVPEIAGDSYLGAGGLLEQLALAYDSGYDRLTTEQRQRWSAFAEQTLQNIWNPQSATWGGRPFPWSGWSICDPGNNYHFSFLRATMLWALAAPSEPWITYLQTRKFPRLVDYYAQLPGGGSREGTGYGTALGSLFDNYLYWLDSTGENLSALSPHSRDTIDYWVHATVPTRDRYAPIGDQSRVSLPDLYDYQENLVHTAVVLNRGTAAARRGTWWLQNNSVDPLVGSFNFHGGLLPYPDTAQAPTDLVYHATGAGVLFARSGWGTDASWIALVAGKYDQSHAHQDQGSFTFFNRDWLTVTPNIWSRSGIHQDVGVHNVLRFERADGSIIGQSPSDSVASNMTSTVANGLVTVAANLTNAYWRDADSVQSWTRSFEFSANTLRVTDTCSVAPGIRPVFQLQVPSQPVQLSNGSLRAGNLLVVPLRTADANWSAMPSGEFSQGYRIDFRAPTCSFAFELRAQ